MGKARPKDTKSHTIYLPLDAHNKVQAMAPYGTWDNVIVECATVEIERRWQKWLGQKVAEANKKVPR